MLKNSKYIDTTAALQVIGCTIQNPNLLTEDGSHFYNEEDFTNDLHKVVFGAIFNLHQMGTNHVTPQSIEDYLKNRPNSYGIYSANRGNEWVAEIARSADLDNFEYYYSRMKKMTLLRAYEEVGVDVSWIYNPDDVFNTKLQEHQEDTLDKYNLNELADLIENKILNIRAEKVDNSTDESRSIGENLDLLFEKLEQEPDVGTPLYDSFFNTVCRGARLGCYYIRSAATGVGKTRTMIADACYIACNEIYDVRLNKWKSIGISQPVLYISTELDLTEVQTMALAFISGVDEGKILNGQVQFHERERITKAIQVLKDSLLYVVDMPDYSLKDVENCIKRNIRLNGCQFIFLDYLQSTLSILSEVSGKAGVKGLREDNVLFLLSAKLKDIANQFNVFVLTSTQLSSEWKTDTQPDQNLLRGAKAISDRADLGAILLDVTQQDKEKIENIVRDLGCDVPNTKLAVYKNRRGGFVRCYLWQIANKATCRFETVFVTNYNYELITNIRPLEIEVGV